MPTDSLVKLDAIVERLLRAARVPGAALAIVADGEVVFASGYGQRDLTAGLPMARDTLYPVASTSKAINATLLGMLIDEGRLALDAPVQKYLPGFRLGDPLISAQVTLRDLITLRTGLPRHDWLWLGHPLSRADLVDRLRHLPLSAGFRARFQYNNLTATAAGYIAEVVTGRSWEALVQERILEPLAMRSSYFALPADRPATLSYHETSDRRLVHTVRLATEVTAPSGGALHSTVEDMARWIAFNLSGGRAAGRQLIEPQTLQEIFSPQVAVGKDPSAPSPGATYALGWFVDTYNGCPRVSHGGYLHDVNSHVALFPRHNVGIVSTTNFGCPRLARLVNQHAFDLLMGLTNEQTIEQKLAEYEGNIEKVRAANAAAARVADTLPSHRLDDHVGVYGHAGYGNIEIRCDGSELSLQRGDLVLQLHHWHYDAWVARDERIFAIDQPHPLDPCNRLLFENDVDGAVCALAARFEPAVAPIRFARI